MLYDGNAAPAFYPDPGVTRVGNGKVAQRAAAAIQRATRAATPFVKACVQGGAVGAIGGPNSAAFGCIVSAIDVATQRSNNTNIRFGGFALAVIGAFLTGNDIRFAQNDPGLPFRKWQTLFADLRSFYRN
jgi:hypothetical protein